MSAIILSLVTLYLVTIAGAVVFTYVRPCMQDMFWCNAFEDIILEDIDIELTAIVEARKFTTDLGDKLDRMMVKVTQKQASINTIVRAHEDRVAQMIAQSQKETLDKGWDIDLTDAPIIPVKAIFGNTTVRLAA